jgi:hypothetical protein
MNTDSAYYIGTTHEECQDYAISGKNSVAVSDGCSGSSNSDIGSRVISVTAMNKMVELDSLISFDEKECILLARPAIKMLNIPNECLDATLLTAKAYDTGAEAMCCGDGVIAIKTKDGKTIVINCEYSDNFPFYMNYLYDQTGRYLNWTTNHNKKVVTQTVINSDWFITSNEEVDKSCRLDGDIGIIRMLDNKTIVEITDQNSVEYIAIMSDGIHSFYETITQITSKFNQALTHVEVLQDLLTFKNFNTHFVQRRMNKFRKKYAKKNCANGDDFSLAVIYLGEK